MAIFVSVSSANTSRAPDSTPRRIVAELPAITVEVVQFTQVDSVIVPYVRIRGVPESEFERVLQDDPQISAVQRLASTEDGAFYKAKWEMDSPVVQCIVVAGGILMDARGCSKEWRLNVCFEDSADASQFQQCCVNRDLPIEVHRVSPAGDVLSGDAPQITEQQREAIVLAYREGYFDEPRRVTQAELGEELGVSSSAVGRRLRRGFRSLVEDSLIE